jgi:general stress protein YciG
MTSKRGFASMCPEKRRECAARGGAAVPAEKRSFATNRALAVSAGRVGGTNVPAERRSFSTNNELARESGKKGGKTRHGDEKAGSEPA